MSILKTHLSDSFDLCSETGIPTICKSEFLLTNLNQFFNHEKKNNF